VSGTCECGNELSGSINCGKFLDWLKIFASQKGLCSVEYVSKLVSYLVSIYFFHLFFNIIYSTIITLCYFLSSLDRWRARWGCKAV